MLRPSFFFMDSSSHNPSDHMGDDGPTLLATWLLQGSPLLGGVMVCWQSITHAKGQLYLLQVGLLLAHVTGTVLMHIGVCQTLALGHWPHETSWLAVETGVLGSLVLVLIWSHGLASRVTWKSNEVDLKYFVMCNISECEWGGSRSAASVGGCVRRQPASAGRSLRRCQDKGLGFERSGKAGNGTAPLVL